MAAMSLDRPAVCFIASASWRRASSSENHLLSKTITPADSGRKVSAFAGVTAVGDAAVPAGAAEDAEVPEDGAASGGVVEPAGAAAAGGAAEAEGAPDPAGSEPVPPAKAFCAVRAWTPG